MKGKTNLNRLLKPLNLYTPPLHDLIIRSYVKHPQKEKFAEKSLFLHAKLFMEKVPPYFVEGRKDTMLYLQIFHPFLKVSPKLLCYKLRPFKKNYQASVFKVMQYGFEIFQTVLSLDCKII